MFEIAAPAQTLPAMSAKALATVRAFAAEELQEPQVDLDTTHVLHGGVYSRTVCLPAGTTITGAPIKIATQVIIQGDVVVWLGSESRRVAGYNVLPASAGRQQVFAAIRETFITMLFPTKAKTVEEAEREFTDEADTLASRRDGARNQIVITGE